MATAKKSSTKKVENQQPGDSDNTALNPANPAALPGNDSHPGVNDAQAAKKVKKSSAKKEKKASTPGASETKEKPAKKAGKKGSKAAAQQPEQQQTPPVDAAAANLVAQALGTTGQEPGTTLADAEQPVKKTGRTKAPKKTSIANTAAEQPATENIAMDKTKENLATPVKSNHIKKVIFQVRYHTKPGEDMFVTGDHYLLGSNDPAKALALQYLNEEYWVGELDIPAGLSIEAAFTYKYFVRYNGGGINMELVADKVFNPAEYEVGEVRLVDTWSFAGFYENTFMTEPFKNVLLRDRYTDAPHSVPGKYTHVFRIKAPLLHSHQVMALYGSAAQLGKWNTSQPIFMHKNIGDDWWTAKVDLRAATYPIAYKYGVHNLQNNQFVQMEGDRNRVLYNGAGVDSVTVLSDGFAVLPNNTFKGAGVAIPVFSLRSHNSFGVGEFNDMKKLVDWAKMVGLKVIQILPVNDTIATHTWVDSYPYAAISAFALHPMFIHLPSVANAQNQHLVQQADDLRHHLNQQESVDYEAVVNNKMEILRKLYPLQKEETFAQPAFAEFFADNKHWLVPYAAFSFLRDQYGTPDFTQWPQNSHFNAQAIHELAGNPSAVPPEIGLYFFIQYHLHLQLKSATQYAHEHNIIVKGDIPIGIYRNSADAWQEPGLYNMDMQAGAPPDDFAVKGQNWGFPTYNWQRMQQDGFTWWKRRFAQMSYYFDAFRIDHILGFFRIWSIPMHAVEGIMGHFVPAVPVYRHELEARGIDLGLGRLTVPYITEGVVHELFEQQAQQVKDTFLHQNGFEFYGLKEAFNTQRKIEAYFTSQPPTPENDALKHGLFDLVSNVILFEVEGSNGNEFHFRISMESTPSFRYLNGHTQQQLRELYVDYFYRRQDHYWEQQAMQKLPELKRSTNMLICGEDLGMVPDCVPGVMKQLGLLSLEIQRMPKDPTREFFHPADAPYLSVVTPSTHDMSTIRGWWEEDKGKTNRFYHQQLGKWGDAPVFCEPEIVKDILVQHFYSPAMWSIFQLQDLMGMDGAIRRNNPHDERINVPANPRHYWRYRMHLTLEDLMNQEAFNNTLRELLAAAGRV